MTDVEAVTDVAAVTDPRVRCGWATSAPEYIAYHDQEWGTEVRGDDAMFQRMSLEAFQSGLSWITILRKRPAFRRAFADFQIAEVARFDEHDVQRLMADSSIVRNSQKITATISNARVAMELDGGLDRFLWSFAPGSHAAPADLSSVPALTPESTAMAGELKKRGFRFVGPTTAYALMQATGMVDGHIAQCWRARV